MPLIRRMTMTGVAASLLLGAVVHAAEHLVRIDDSGRAAIVSSVPKEIGPSEVLWMWSDDCAPHRVSTLPAGHCPDAETIEFRVTAHSRRPIAGQQIRWGTAEMLEELPTLCCRLPSSIRRAKRRFAYPKTRRFSAALPGRSLLRAGPICARARA